MSRLGGDEEEPTWTIDQAADYFAAGGVPIGATRLAAIIREIRRAARDAGAPDELAPVGETRSGETGGRGKALYRVAALMDLHRDLARWVAGAPPEPCTGRPADTPVS